MFEQLIEAPELDPVTVPDQCDFSGVDEPDQFTDDSPPQTTSEWANIAGFISAASVIVESDTNRAFITQQWRLMLDAFPDQHLYFNRPTSFHLHRQQSIPLWHSPVQSIDLITYIDVNGDEQTWDESNYELRADEVCLVLGKTWPITALVPNAVTIETTCGYGDTAADVPASIKTAIQFQAGHFVENRGLISTEPTFQVKRTISTLLRRYVVPHVAKPPQRIR